MASGRTGPGAHTISRRPPGVSASTAKNITVLSAMPRTPKASVHTSAAPREVWPLVQIAVNSTRALETSQAAVTTPAELGRRHRLVAVLADSRAVRCRGGRA